MTTADETIPTQVQARQLPNRIRLLALDIDDTLTGSDGRISPANMAAVRLAMDRGILVTAITGRRYRASAERFADDIGIAGPLACHYGRAVVEHPEGTFLRQHYVPLAAAKRVLDYANRSEIIASVCADETFFFDRRKDIKSVEGAQKMWMSEWVDGFDGLLAERGSRIMTIGLSGEGAEGVRDLLQPEIRSGTVSVCLQRMSGRPDKLAIVMAGGSDKGTALVELCELLGVDPTETIALGDSEADIPMLLAAGHGIAMPWAEEHVREAADAIAAGRPEDAAGRAIEAILASRVPG